MEANYVRLGYSNSILGGPEWDSTSRHHRRWPIVITNCLVCAHICMSIYTGAFLIGGFNFGILGLGI
jgi:hypothetical protein